MKNKTPQLKNGYFPIAKGIAEYMARTYMSSYESQIVWAIFLKTYGWHKKEDQIANSQFVGITGIHKAHVSRTIKKLLLRNIVTQIGNKIAFQKDASLWLKLPKRATVTQIGQELPKQAPELPEQADTKDTITKYTKQKIKTYSKEYGHGRTLKIKQKSNG